MLISSVSSHRRFLPFHSNLLVPVVCSSHSFYSRFSFDQGQQLASEIGALAYVECSARTNTNVKGVIDKALELLLSPPEMKDSKRGSDGRRGRAGGCVLL